MNKLFTLSFVISISLIGCKPYKIPEENLEYREIKGHRYIKSTDDNLHDFECPKCLKDKENEKDL